MQASDSVDIDIGTEARDPAIRALDVSMFDRNDLLNMLLQRSEVLYDRPKGVQPIKAWTNGDSRPILAEIDRLGDEIVRRVAGVIHAEYRAMRDRLGKLAPRRVADIGCGYAIWDLFAARDLGCEIVLIDIETNQNRHFGFAAEGSAYTDLDRARQFLVANGVPASRIVAINPQKKDIAGIGVVDLAVSFVSCGFHYPVAAYLDFFTRQVAPGGSVLVDPRETRAESQLRDIAPLGRLETLPSHPKARRVLVRKAA